MKDIGFLFYLPRSAMMIKKETNKILLPEPTEETEQLLLFQWAELFSRKYSELKLLLHIPNGGKREKAEAGRLKAMGVKAGIPDVFLPVPCGNLHGLWIELKRIRSGRPTTAQKEWITLLNEQGYAAQLCHGWEHASKVILDYLNENAK